MGKPAAKAGDHIVAQDTHIVMVPAAAGAPVPTVVPGYQFDGIINDGLSKNVRINGRFAAMRDSTADNTPPHMPREGPSFQFPPTNKGQIVSGSGCVRINQRPAARDGDTAITCDDVAPMAPKGTVTTSSSQKLVRIGD